MTRIALWCLAVAAVFAASPSSAAVASSCLDVEDNRLLASNLAPSWPALRQLPGDTVFGYTPSPGARRVFRMPELERLAARYQVPPPASAFCVEHAMELLDRDRLAAAMQAGLQLAEARIDILEFGRFPVPRGELHFPRSGLAFPSGAARQAAVLWKGYVQYSGARRFPVWARVRVSASRRQVVALENLPAGTPVRESQVRLETGEGFPLRQGPAQSLAEVVGRVPHRSISSGAVIALSQLEEPREVNRGDTVDISVETAAAHLSFRGRAETAGRMGETVSIRNLSSGKTFAARVEEKGRVTVDLPPPAKARTAGKREPGMAAEGSAKP